MLTLLRASLLGIWYRLSDVELAQTLFRDLLFRKFCHRELGGDVPDASTIGRFRQKLVDADLWEQLLGEVNRQLEVKHIIITEGRINIIDATPIEAAQSGIRKGDPDAGSHVKVNAKGKMQAKWGFQAFVNIDEEGFIFATALTPGKKHAINSLSGLLDGSEDMLFADSAYLSRKIRNWMNENNIKDRVQRKGYPLAGRA